MAISLAPYPSSTEAQTQSSLYNDISSENRPARRDHPFGGTLVWGTINKPTVINPTLTTHSVSMTIQDLLFNRLIRINSRGEIEPDLAKTWDISEDGLVYTFYLRAGVLFHDGFELTAEDVKFTYEQINDPENNSPWRTNTELVDRWEVIDPYTVRMVLKETFHPILSKLSREIIPKHLWEGENLVSSELNYAPVGTGPFKFEGWDQEIDQIELEANPLYFEGRPYLNRIIFKKYADRSELWTALMRREIDLTIFIRREDYAVVKGDPAFKAYAVPASMYYALVYNLGDSIWQDQQLRQAIAHGIDIEAIIEALPRFEGIKSTGPFHSDSPGYNDQIQLFNYDPVKAKMMLMHRGWQNMEQDAYNGEVGIRMKSGRELTMRMLVHERDETFKQIAKIIRQQLAEIGVKVMVLYYQDEEQLTEEFMKQNNVQVWLRLYQGLGLNPYEVIASWYYSPTELGQFGKYKNSEIDRLLELGNKNKDPRERGLVYQKIHEIIYQDQPACFLFFPVAYFAVNADFQNTDEYFSMYMPPYTFKDWYISKN